MLLWPTHLVQTAVDVLFATSWPSGPVCSYLLMFK